MYDDQYKDYFKKDKEEENKQTNNALHNNFLSMNNLHNYYNINNINNYNSYGNQYNQYPINCINKINSMNYNKYNSVNNFENTNANMNMYINNQFIQQQLYMSNMNNMKNNAFQNQFNNYNINQLNTPISQLNNIPSNKNINNFLGNINNNTVSNNKYQGKDVIEQDVSLTQNQINISLLNISNISKYLSPYKFPNNPSNFHARFFVLKSIDEDNVIKSIRYSLWSSTQKGNSKLNKVYKDSINKYPIYLFFSVNCSGKFLGVARMDSEIDCKLSFSELNKTDKWKGYFKLHWIIIKDIPNKLFKNLNNSLNENKCVISSRDTQEIEKQSGDLMMQIAINSTFESSIIDNLSTEDKKDEVFEKYSTFISENYISQSKEKKLKEKNH